MDVILVPGLWLDAASWDPVLPALRTAGHTPHALTMPGTGESDTESIGLAEWIDAVTALIDSLDGPVVLVGHSGGGNVVWGATDARPDRVARVVFVDSVPPPPGAAIAEFAVVDGVVPFPGWERFDAADVADLDTATREREAARAQAIPARVPTDAIGLADARRFGVPVTILSGGMDAATLEAALAGWREGAREYAAISSKEVVRLGTGHWPQFSRPDALAAALVDALG